MQNLRDPHLPAMRECFEQAAQQAEKETLSYEQYLLQLTQAGVRVPTPQPHRPRYSRESGLPREKTMPNFDLKPITLLRQRDK